ncbi:nitroreductase family protein [Algoriphagus zhangzhouensis]|uniref:Nitroreductase n=1 Tax=Algoriphagus zhangzhouensis TaxID=1073327 RepID=A0A1M7ZIE7_9BACT|nr:nitroreductase family protein [Algoriphagus zhangzhouensis]TDY44351.1 nitroreductase [Algoriphagus zhangzhouensis]SHO64599.1 Nitroreductase [Algoriphagus zhangzhouensis]
MNVLQNLKWRYATKAMNGQVVPQEKVDYILDAIQLSASSSGLQPYEVLLITDPEVKAKIRKVAYDQSQITDASHVLVFAAWDQYTEERVNKVFKRNNIERGLDDSATDAYRTRLLGMFQAQSQEENFTHAAKQAYIALGSALVAAAEQKVDSTPMEGFDNKGLDEVLNLKEKGLKSVIVLPLGYRDETKDWLVNMKKVRTPKEELITQI